VTGLDASSKYSILNIQFQILCNCPMSLSRVDAFFRLPLIKQLIVLFVLAVALAGAIPGYMGSQWAWQQVPEISHTRQLKALQKQGLQLPGWRTLEQKTVEIGGHKWSVQAIVPEATSELMSQSTSELTFAATSKSTSATSPVTLPENSLEMETDAIQKAVWLLLRPQTWGKDMPQIDWTDINGVRQWTTDSEQSLSFTIPATASANAQSQNQQSQTVDARFFRGWTQQRTDAVLQWYAWSSGGHSAPSRWFWADQWQQLHSRRRLAWVAVSIQLPIKPLGEIDQAEPDAKALGELVQSTLLKTVFQ
jgi:cyanoexosortase B-associated protein